MDSEAIQFIRSVLPGGRTVYYSFQDRHAFLILENVIGDNGTSVGELKKSRFSSLMNKKPIKDILAHSGSGKIFKEDLKQWWPEKPEAFRLTLGTWPELDEKPSKRWSQVTRYGWNLVLQLNFSSEHKRKLQELVPDWERPLKYSHHPIAKGGELTLAWSRIDIDLDKGEALIEEIQSDWVRDVKHLANHYLEANRLAWGRYFEKVLKPETARWSETMLTATLWFLLNELGIKRVFYHTHETGSLMKNINVCKPPRSIYKDLPDKFCFSITHNGPSFVRDAGNRELWKKFTEPDTKWYILDFS